MNKYKHKNHNEYTLKLKKTKMQSRYFTVIKTVKYHVMKQEIQGLLTLGMSFLAFRMMVTLTMEVSIVYPNQ